MLQSPDIFFLFYSKNNISKDFCRCLLHIPCLLLYCSVIVEAKVVAGIFYTSIDLFTNRSCHNTEINFLSCFRIYINFTIGNYRLAISLWISIWIFPFFGEKTRAVMQVKQAITFSNQFFQYCNNFCFIVNFTIFRKLSETSITFSNFKRLQKNTNTFERYQFLTAIRDKDTAK